MSLLGGGGGEGWSKERRREGEEEGGREEEGQRERGNQGREMERISAATSLLVPSYREDNLI